MDIRIEMPGKSVRRDPTGATLAKTLRSAAAGICFALGKSIRQRVAVRGNNEQRTWTYSRKQDEYERTFTDAKGRKKTVKVRPRYHVSPNYPAQGGQKSQSLGTTTYATSQEFHRAMGTKAGSFNVNRQSGMWSGLTVRPLSPTRSRLEFRGRSVGQQPAWKLKKVGRKPRKGKDTRKRTWQAKSRKISNALKAASVWHTTRVSLLSPSDKEMKILGNAVQALVVDAIGRSAFAGHHPDAPRIPKSAFIDLMMRAQLGGGKIR